MIQVKIQNILKQYGEWDIKLKNKQNDLLKKTFINFLIKIVIWTISVPLIFMIIAEIISRLDFQWLYNLSSSKYYTARDFFDIFLSGGSAIIFILIIWLSGTLIFLYRLLKKIFSYIDAVFNASSKLLDKDTPYIELPKELEFLQRQMNNLKHESEKNERLAKESEQRKNDLVVYLAHDIKTPLTSMIGYLSLLDEIKDMPNEQREKYINITLDKSYRLEELINELFDITRFNSEKIILEPERLNLNMMLEQIIDDFYPTLKEMNKEIKISFGEKIELTGDSDKLARVFNNVIKNAINYSSNNSVIEIKVSKDKNYVTIVVINRGKKIKEEKLNKIFEKFYRADTSRTTRTGGSGLGLAIAKEIVELHGGKISASSDDEYTKFYISLPIK